MIYFVERQIADVIDWFLSDACPADLSEIYIFPSIL
jgi:hypothetical protein